MAENQIVVPVGESATMRTTIDYVATKIAEAGVGTIHLVYLASWRDDDPNVEARRREARNYLEQAAVWTEFDLEEVNASNCTVETAILGTDQYLFGPGDYADRLVRYVEDNGLDQIILDPDYSPIGNNALLQPLEFELAQTDLVVREAPTGRQSRRERVVQDVSGRRFGALFAGSLLFYLVLGDPTYWFDWVTGVMSGLIVAITLSHVSLDRDPSLATAKRLLRGAVYVPVLLVEIVKSNLVVARVILSPSLPVNPTMTRVRVRVGSGLVLTTLANSITLTPGTLTVRAKDENLYIHTLIPWAREGLFDGSLERWARFIFYGRAAARLPSPAERGDTAILQGQDADERLPFAETDGKTDDGPDQTTDADASGPAEGPADSTTESSEVGEE